MKKFAFGILILMFGAINADENHEHHESHENHSHHATHGALHHYDLHTHAESKQVDFATLSAKVGIFGKTSILSSKEMGAKNDNYAMLYSQFLLQSAPFANADSALDGVVAGLGAVAYAPFYSDKIKYINSNFVANTAYLGYVKDFERVGVEVKAGRFDEHLEWVGHSMQGVFGRVTLPFSAHSAQIYGIWVNEQAHIMREISGDFDFYKSMYDGQNLFAGGANLALTLGQNLRFHIEPYAYYLHKYFGVYGAKVAFDASFADDWRSKTIAQGAFLHSNYAKNHANMTNMANHAHAGHNHAHNHSAHTHLNTANRGDTYFVFIEQEFAYKDFLYFGAGFQRVGAKVFEIANLGNNSRFEAHEGGGFGVIRPGAIHSGTQITNAYNADTNTFYGFIGAQFGSENEFALEAMGRDSRSDKKSQSAFSLGARYALPYGFEIGGIGVFMLDKHPHGMEEMRVWRNYGKAYLQWQF
ncbi:hypothetical protein ACWIUD_02985 [Helicobacter sp. 23-1044]